MCIRQTVAGSVGVARLAFDACAALASIVVVVPLVFVWACATAANTARRDLASPREPADAHLCDLGVVVEL